MDDVKSQFSDDPANFHPHAFTTDCLDEDATIPLAGPHEPSAYDNVSRWHTRVHSRPLKVEGLIATAPLEKGCDTKKFSPHDDHCDSDSDSEALTSDFSSLHLSSLAATQARTTFATYNCNGLANLVRKGFFRRFLAKHSPDILILTEVKMSLKRLFAFGALHILLRAFGYEFCYYNPQIRDTGGLHGTAIISKIKPQHVVCGYLDVDTTQVTPNSSPLPSPSVDPDDAKLSMDLDGRCITAVFEDFAVVNSYTPCSGFPKEGRTQLDLLAKDAFRKRYETALEQHCLNVKALYSKPVILSGDLNVTASRHDCFHRRNNPRFPGCKPWERDGFANICASLQLCDAYRELNPAYRSSDCTWWNTYYHWKHGKGLRLDYFLVPDTWRKEHLNRTAQEPTLLECYLDRNIRGSDHCPVFMSIAIPKSNTAEPSNLSALVPIHRDTKQYNFALVYEPRLHSDTRAPNASLTPGLPSRSAFLESDTMTALCAAVDCFSLATTENCDPHCPSPSVPVDGCPHNADAHYIPSFCSEREQAFDRWADSNEPPDCAPRMPAGCRHSSDAAAVTSVRRAHAVHASVPVANVMAGQTKLIELRALFDTGAACSILSRAAFNRLNTSPNQYKLFSCESSGPTFSLANGDTVRPVGWTTMHLHFNDRPWLHKMYVLEHSNFELLLGVDFMSRAGANISFNDRGQGNITFRKILGDSSVPFQIQNRSTIRGSAAPLVLPTDMVLRPRTQYTLSLNLLDCDDLFHCGGLHGQVDRLAKGADARHRVPIGISAVRNGSVVSQIANFTDKPSFLPKGTVVAFFRPAWVVSKSSKEDLEAPDVCVVDNLDAKQVFYLPAPDEKILDTGDTKENLPISVVYLDDYDDDDPAVFDDDGIHVDLVPKLKHLWNSGRVTLTQFRRLKKLLIDFKDIFADRNSSPPVAKIDSMHIEVPANSVPVAAPLRRYNPRERLLLIEHATRLLKQGVLERCNSAWRAQPLMIPKKDGGFRVALSYVRLNAITKPIAANLPNLQDSLDSLGGAEVFTSCDILSAYYTCDLYEPHRDYTAFFVPTLGNLRFTRASMGLRNSQTYFVNLTMKMLEGLMFESVVAYSDDLVSYSPNMDKHIDVDLPALFLRVREYNIKLKASKVDLCTDRFSWCGMVVTKDGVATDPAKVAAIDAIKIENLSTLKKLRSFVGSCNFLRRWIPKYSDVVEPLRPLFKQGMFRKPNKWTPLQRLSIEEMKSLLRSAPVMAHPDFSKPFYIYCDASKTCVAGALVQFDGDGHNDGSSGPKVIAYLSKAMNPAQQNYATHEQECLALLYCLETWRSYVFGQPKVTVYTDSKAVEWMVKPTSAYTGRCLRWVLRASEWPLDVQHRSGVTHCLPDMLTRCVSEHYSKELKNPIEPLNAVAPAAQVGGLQLPLSVSTRSQVRASARASRLGSSNVPPGHSPTKPTPPATSRPLIIEMPDGTRRTRAKPFICYNCRTPHPSGEWGCMQPCRLCKSRKHTRFSCPERPHAPPTTSRTDKTTPQPHEPLVSSHHVKPTVDEAEQLPCGDKTLTPFKGVLPGALDPRHIWALRPDIVLLHQVDDKNALIREHQAADAFCVKIASTLSTTKCRKGCTGCSHDKACPHYYWCCGTDGILLRRSFREPVVSQAESVRIAQKLRDTPCVCPVSKPNTRCPHHAYAIRSLRRPAAKRRRHKRLREHPGPERECDRTVEPAADPAHGKRARTRGDIPDDQIPVAHLFSRRDASSFDPAAIVEDFDRKIVCPRTYKVVIPTTLVTSFLFDLHGNLVNGHCGMTTCRARARHSYWWKGMHKDITRWIAACLTCRRRKPGQPSFAGAPGAMSLPPRPFHTIHVDHSGPWPKTESGNLYILSIVDPYSRWPISVPVSNRKASNVVRALLEYVVANYASPEILVSDGAPEFIGKTVAGFCRIFQIQHRVNPPYSPSLNSPVERFHDWLNAMLTVLVSRDKKNWDRMLPLVLFSYRTSPVSGVGLSPYQILYNRDPRMPSQLSSAWSTPQAYGDPDTAEMDEISRTIHGIVQRAHDTYVSKRRAARPAPARANEYSLGDFCLTYAPQTEITPAGVSNKPKLRDHWSHPRMIVAKGAKNTWVVQDANGKLYEVRPDIMVPYRFYFDGKPSIDSRPRYSPAERRALQSDPVAFRPPVAVVGDLCVFPMSLEDDDAFGVGRVESIDANGAINFHWYGNMTDNLFGTYEPLWIRPDRTWYPASAPTNRAHRAVCTNDYLEGFITQADLADVGFKLLNRRVPAHVIQRVSDNPLYRWCLDDDNSPPDDNVRFVSCLADLCRTPGPNRPAGGSPTQN